MTILPLLLAIAIFAYSIFILLSHITTGKLAFEVVTYLLPYWLVFNLLLLASVFIIQIEFKDIFRLKFLTVSMIFLSLVTVILAARFIGFTYLKVPEVIAQTSETQLRIVFFNKLYSNTNYQQIDQKLKEIDPDIIGFSEIKEIDKKHISHLKQYKYSHTKHARDGATISFYSKFPTVLNKEFSELPHVLPISVQVADKSYQVYVIHPAPPINSKWLLWRDNELESLTKQIIDSQKPNTILMGDFNLPPWSATYQKLEKELSELKNVAQGQGLQFTWHNTLLTTQVDHIFVPSQAIVKSFNNERMNGSDHNLIWTEIEN